MSRTTDRIDHLGPPQIKLAGLQIWVHGRESPDRADYWDGNWLRVTANCGGHGADVWADGSILHLSEIEAWEDTLAKMSETFSGEARLGGSLEPNLSVEMKLDRLGHLAVRVEITPDHMTQKHQFDFDCDQTFLLPLLSQIRRLLSEYPIRDEQRV